MGAEAAASRRKEGPLRDLHRRDLLALTGGIALASLTAAPCARAQTPARMPVIGFLGATTATVWSPLVATFTQRMRELGWIDGHNVIIEYRWAEGRPERYAEHAAELVRRKVDVLVTAGTPGAMALKKATSTIPIVFAAAGDPVQTGLVTSLARPGGNVTGLSNQQADLGGYKLELLRQVVPQLRRVAVMGNIDSSLVRLEMDEVMTAAKRLKLDAFRVELKATADIVPSLESLKGRADGLYVCSDPLLTTHRVRINTFAVAEKLPTIYQFREYVAAGGLMSYGPNLPDLFRRSGDYVDKILRGSKPADLPVEQPLKFDLVINNATAKALGLTIPESFLLRANEVIE